jgi:hypothetical protein
MTEGLHAKTIFMGKVEAFFWNIKHFPVRMMEVWCIAIRHCSQLNKPDKNKRLGWTYTD